MPRKAAIPNDLYDVHPAVAYAKAVIANLPAKTGKSIEEWVSLVKKDAPAGTKERREWLKKRHQLGGTTASMIVNHAEDKGGEDTDPDTYLRLAAGYVEAMYSGARSALRPIHDELIQLGRSLGKGVKVCPCKTIVPLYRNHVFAQIKPTTRTRIDLGLALKGCTEKLSARLIDTGGLASDDRITHRIPIESADEIDATVKAWLKTAYDLDVTE